MFGGADVRLRSISTKLDYPADVRFPLDSDRTADIEVGRFVPISGIERPAGVPQSGASVSGASLGKA